MSIKTWCDEFMDVDVEDVAQGAIPALEHSVKKWKGLTQEQLDKHGVRITKCEDSGSIWLGDHICLGCSSCALCHQFLDEDGDEDGYGGCARCPITQVRGAPCDESITTRVEGNIVANNPWFSFSDNRDPKPMITLLEQTLDFKLAEQ